jgi:hypothetical protein
MNILYLDLNFDRIGCDRIPVNVSSSIKLNNLIELLKISIINYKKYENILKNNEQFRDMNNQILSQVIIFLYKNNDNPDDEKLHHDNINNYVNILTNKFINDNPELTENDIKIIKLRHSSIFYRYLRYMMLLINSYNKVSVDFENVELTKREKHDITLVL